MIHRQTLAIIGSGPSCIYLLKHLLDGVEFFRKTLSSIEIFEKRRTAGMGMPYHPETTEQVNLSNISSEELPPLTNSFADWLREQDAAQLEEFGIEREEISESEVYSRLALGAYLNAQYRALSARLTAAGLPVREHTDCKIVDLRDEPAHVTLFGTGGARFEFDRVVVATGHQWPENDHPESGYFASPWPIAKLLPMQGESFNYPVGTLGASLSAIDVVSSLAHRHGRFVKEAGGLVFHPHPGAEKFQIVMHSSDNMLPHLQYSQVEPLREIERYVSKEELFALRDERGFLRLATYFDRVCRRVLSDAFEKDSWPELVMLLNDPEFGVVEFSEKMTEEHKYPDAFAGMRSEMGESVNSLTRDKPVHWKEAVDDLMYTLSFYAELLPAEDHITLHSTFLPFIMNVTAALPLPSARKLLALCDAGKLEIIRGRAHVEEPSPEATETRVTVDDDGRKSECVYRMFIDCSGQGPVKLEDFPFPGLLAAGGIREARAAFANADAAKALPEKEQEKVTAENGQPSYSVGGIDIDRAYRLLGRDGRSSECIVDLSFPHTAGLRPYSYGLQACNDTARILVAAWQAAHP